MSDLVTYIQDQVQKQQQQALADLRCKDCGRTPDEAIEANGGPSGILIAGYGLNYTYLCGCIPDPRGPKWLGLPANQPACELCGGPLFGSWILTCPGCPDLDARDQAL